MSFKRPSQSGDQISGRVYHDHGKWNLFPNVQPCQLKNNVENIACYIGRYCVFYQKGASGTLKEALGYVDDLLNEGCQVCGSVPTSSDDVDDGELSVDYIWNREYKCMHSDGATMCSDDDIRFMKVQHDTPEDHPYDDDSNDGP